MLDLKNTVIGVEFGSTRIKAVMLDVDHQPIASGSFGWENQFEDGIWTYHYDEIIRGLQACFANLKADVLSKFGVKLETCGAMGISAMMHGYIPTDSDFKPLCAFRTWRNTITGEASEKLTELFGFNIPQRWCIAHLYQAFLNKEEHLEHLSHVFTLASFVSRMLTGINVIGVDDGSGVFPLDSGSLDYDRILAEKFLSLTGLDVYALFPKVIGAGCQAGCLTEEGALLLDPTGELKAGIPFAPAEGDAGTGMVATDSVRLNTGNISAGTSDFIMIVTNRKLGVHKEIGMVATPSGLPVAMVHCSNCTTDINSWINLFGEFAQACGLKIDSDQLYSMLYSKALEANADCGGLLSCNYYSGESVTGFDSGLPIFLHKPSSEVHLADFMRLHLSSAVATLKMGVDILRSEGVEIQRLYGHGGYFKTPKVGQRILSAAMGIPVSVMETAGEGGPYGMALLCAYMLWNKGKTLEDYLDENVFASSGVQTVMASENEIKGFDSFMAGYRKMLQIERKSLEVFNA